MDIRTCRYRCLRLDFTEKRPPNEGDVILPTEYYRNLIAPGLFYVLDYILSVVALQSRFWDSSDTKSSFQQ